MKNRTKVVTILLLFALTVGVFGVGKKDTTEPEAPVKFSYLSVAFGPATFNIDSAFTKILFDMANVDIDIRPIVFTDYATQLPTIIAGGDIPDMFGHNGPLTAFAYDIIEQGACAPLDDLLNKYRNIKNAYPDSIWEKCKSPDGKIYSLPIGNVVVPYVPFGIRYRKDLFDKYNLGVPKTLDEFVEDMRLIVDNEPDVSIGLSADYYVEWAFQNIGPAFGFAFGNWRPAPGEPMNNPKEIIPSTVSPEYKEFLRWMNMLRKEELLDPDYLIIKGPGGDDKFKKGQVVAIVGGWWAMLDEYKDLKLHNPEWDVAMMPSLQGPKGMTACTTLNPVLNYYSISSEANADEIMSFVDWYYSKEGYAFMRRGVWGKMFNIMDDKGKLKDKQARFYGIEEENREEGYKTMDHKIWQWANKFEDIFIELKGQYVAVYRFLNLENPMNQTDKEMRESAYEFMMQIQVMYEQAAKNTFPDYKRGAYSETEGKVGQQLMEQYINPMAETLSIDPNADVDELFDDAVANWYKDGGQKIVDEINAKLTDKSRPNDPELVIQYSDWSKADFLNLSAEEMDPKDFFDFLPVPDEENPIPENMPEYYVFK